MHVTYAMRVTYGMHMTYANGSPARPRNRAHPQTREAG